MDLKSSASKCTRLLHATIENILNIPKTHETQKQKHKRLMAWNTGHAKISKYLFMYTQIKLKYVKKTKNLVLYHYTKICKAISGDLF